MSFKPSIAQQNFYDWITRALGNAILDAVAGAGKTTTLIEGLQIMMGSVWFGVFNKQMADEINIKINANDKLRARAAFGNRQDPLLASTFHSLGFNLMRNFNGRDTVTTVDDKKVEKIVDALIAHREDVDQQKRPDLHDLRNGVIAIVGMAKNRGIGALCPAGHHDVWVKMIEDFDFESSLPDNYNEVTVVKFAMETLRRSNKDVTTLDYNDMVYMPLACKVRPKPWNQFDWVLIDEAQDTNPTRRALAKLVMRNNKSRLVAVGDHKQAIFGFTGADNDALQQIGDAFKAKKLPLSVSYRCSKSVVAHARQWADHIEPHEGAPEGSVTEIPIDMLLDSLSSVTASETAIICRYNKPLVDLCFNLIRKGVPARIEGRSIGNNLKKMATRWKKVVTVNGLETKICEYRDREVAKALKKEKEDKADRITDEVATLLTLIDRTRGEGKSTVVELCEIIDSMFADNVVDEGGLTLCSAHKSKGLEWENVYLLGREEYMPSKMARQEWQIEQESNLIYVAITRAKKNLIEVKVNLPGKDA